MSHNNSTQNFLMKLEYRLHFKLLNKMRYSIIFQTGTLPENPEDYLGSIKIGRSTKLASSLPLGKDLGCCSTVFGRKDNDNSCMGKPTCISTARFSSLSTSSASWYSLSLTFRLTRDMVKPSIVFWKAVAGTIAGTCLIFSSRSLSPSEQYLFDLMRWKSVSAVGHDRRRC